MTYGNQADEIQGASGAVGSGGVCINTDLLRKAGARQMESKWDCEGGVQRQTTDLKM